MQPSPDHRSGVVAVRALFAAVLAFSAVGCNQPEPVAIDHLSGPGGFDEPMPRASSASWQADFDRLAFDIPRAVKKLHWGLAAVRRQPQGDHGTAVVRATAVLPNGREATIVSWQPQAGWITVALRVGHFGDRRQERLFVRQLASVLRGKPSRKHRQGFAMPSPVP